MSSTGAPAGPTPVMPAMRTVVATVIAPFSRRAGTKRRWGWSRYRVSRSSRPLPSAMMRRLSCIRALKAEVTVPT